MMTNLFSSFDTPSIVFSMNWMSSFLGLNLIPLTFWFIPNRFLLLTTKFYLIYMKNLMSSLNWMWEL